VTEAAPSPSSIWPARGRRIRSIELRDASSVLANVIEAALSWKGPPCVDREHTRRLCRASDEHLKEDTVIPHLGSGHPIPATKKIAEIFAEQVAQRAGVECRDFAAAARTAARRERLVAPLDAPSSHKTRRMRADYTTNPTGDEHLVVWDAGMRTAADPEGGAPHNGCCAAHAPGARAGILGGSARPGALEVETEGARIMSSSSRARRIPPGLPITPASAETAIRARPA